jgi:hypothetical protein
MVVALVALLAALNGPALARQATHRARKQAHKHKVHRTPAIDGARIKASSITSRQIRDGSLGPQDLRRGVLPDLSRYYTRQQSDAQFVNHVPGTPNVAPNAAALGGVAAGRYYTAAQSSAKFVNGSGHADAASLTEPSGTATRFDLIAVPQVGAFRIDCTGSAANLYFDPSAGAGEVDLVTSVVQDPGGVTSLRSDKVTGGELAFDPTSARERWQIQALRPGDGSVATITVSLTWHDPALAPAGCLALAEYHSAPA